jgi:hypothetical protein
MEAFRKLRVFCRPSVECIAADAAGCGGDCDVPGPRERRDDAIFDLTAPLRKRPWHGFTVPRCGAGRTRRP